MKRVRTDTRDSGTEVGQDGGTGVAHLTLDGELSLDIDLSNYSSEHKSSNAGQKENGGEDNDGNEFREHADAYGEDGVKIVRNRTVDYN